MPDDQNTGKLTKGEGSFYTPFATAEIICDIAGYTADNTAVLTARVIDPAAGDGAILVVAAKRFIECALAQGWSSDKTAAEICRLFFAYEIDEAELEKCRDNVAMCATKRGIEISPSDLLNFISGDTFALYKQHEHSMDFVLGNPPYVRIHNLEEKPDSSYVEGMCDLYYPFYDVGQRLLSDNGVLCYIAPSSWFTAKAGQNMREDLHRRGVVSAVCDFGHYQVFAGYATTYTAIVKLTRTSNEKVRVYDVDQDNGFVLSFADTAQAACWVDGLFLPGSPSWLIDALRAKGDIRVLNGYATNLDRVFISKQPRFAGSDFEKKIVKASKCEQYYMLYPYDEQGRLIPFEVIEAGCPAAATLLTENKSDLLARTQVDSETWWCFARSQGIGDTFHDKVAVQTLVKPGVSLRSMDAPAGCGVYGGVYVLGISKTELDQALASEEFLSYAKALRKYKSGGYYALGGKDLEHFLNWWQSQKDKN